MEDHIIPLYAPLIEIDGAHYVDMHNMHEQICHHASTKLDVASPDSWETVRTPVDLLARPPLGSLFTYQKVMDSVRRVQETDSKDGVGHQLIGYGCVFDVIMMCTGQTRSDGGWRGRA